MEFWQLNVFPECIMGLLVVVLGSGVDGVSQNQKRYFVDLFAGCGGLSLGLEQAGFEPILVNELNRDAMETYLMNRDKEFPLLREKYNTSNIWSMINDKELIERFKQDMSKDFGISVEGGDLDLVVGGPPCQGYSGIGHRRSYSVEKEEYPSNHLYQAMIKVIEEFNPKIFLFENVKGILSGKWTASGEKGEIWEDIRTSFETIPNYSVRWKLVKAKDYGVPQNRPRVLLVGVRNDIADEKSLPDDAIEAGFLPQAKGDYPNLNDLLSDLEPESVSYGDSDDKYWTSPQTSVQRKLRTKPSGTLLRKGSRLTEQEYSNHSERVREKFQAMHDNGGKIPEQYRTKKFAQKLLPEIWDERGPTITATCLADDYVHYSQARSLTVREWARLQMFPDWYRFAGKRTTGGIRRAGNPREGIYERELPKYTQIGNAVPVELARRIGLNFLNILEGKNA